MWLQKQRKQDGFTASMLDAFKKGKDLRPSIDACLPLLVAAVVRFLK
jgi:hypothetical protein